MTERKKVVQQVRENPVVAVIGLLGVLASGISVTTVVNAVRVWDSLATQEYVNNALRDSESSFDGRLTQHAVEADQRFDNIEDGQERIRAFVEIVPELKDLLTIRCMTGTMNLEVSITRLKGEYFDLTGEVYNEPSCERLLARAF